MVVGVVYGMMCGVTRFPYLVSADSLSGCGLIFVLMSPVTIDSIPSGAGVSIDGEFVGVTPVSVGVVGDLQEFRDTCMDGGQVSCGWDVLVVWLEDHRVSGFWWDMTTPERRAVATMAIENTIFRSVFDFREGLSDCKGSTGDWGNAVCMHNALIRFLKFGSPVGIEPYTKPIDECYYYLYPDEFCYRPDLWYDLPCHYVTEYSSGYCHFLASIHVVPGIASIDNWVMFQYDRVNIPPKDWRNYSFTEIKKASCDACGGTRLATFERVP